MNTQKTARALSVALLMLVVFVFASDVAYADRDKDRRDRDKKHQDDRRDHQRDKRKPSVWLNFDRSIYRSVRTYDQVWIPGHYETRIEQVLVEPGHYETIVIPAKYVTYYDRERRRQSVIVEASRKERVWVEPVYEPRAVQVWVPGYYTQTLVTRCRPVNSGLSFSFRF
ncbi:MAG: hypothetical protein JXA52_02245 [Planctomycetes bacterium]|nr:hypothetical protein [Planctomycetota bacterium]